MNNSEEMKHAEPEVPFMKRTLKLINFYLPYWVVALIVIVILFALYYFLASTR